MINDVVSCDRRTWRGPGSTTSTSWKLLRSCRTERLRAEPPPTWVGSTQLEGENVNLCVSVSVVSVCWINKETSSCCIISLRLIMTRRRRWSCAVTLEDKEATTSRRREVDFFSRAEEEDKHVPKRKK